MDSGHSATIENPLAAGGAEVATETLHAPAARLSGRELAPVLEYLQRNPIVQAMLDGHAEIAVLLNGQRQIVACNRALLDVLGLADASSIMGRRVGEVLTCVHAAEMPGGCGTSETCQTCGAVNAMLACQRSGQASREECRISTGNPDHPDAWDLEVVATPLDAGELQLMSFAARDIAAIKRREVFERFFFHDALNVAGGIKGFAEMLETGEAFDASIHPQRLGSMAHHLIEQLRTQRDLAAAERGELSPRWSTIRVGDLLNDLRATYESHPVAQGRRLRFESPGLDGLAFQSDSILLGRVLGNLTKNALEASEPGGCVTITCERLQDDRLRFSIHNATVMPREVRLQVFKRSFSTKGEKGRGLGTFSVKLLTSQYLGGAVDFTSAEGEGTVFRVTIPRRQTADWRDAATVAQAGREQACLAGYRVLLAEDDVDIQRLIAHFLKKAGAEVLVAGNGKLVLEAALAARRQGTPFDAILMDMQMPEMDGYTAAGLLREHGCTETILALTAHALEGERRKCLEAGCDDYAAKPIERGILVETVVRNIQARPQGQGPA